MIHPVPSCAPSPSSTVFGPVTSTILVLRPNTDTERDVARKKVQTTSFMLGLLERWILWAVPDWWRYQAGDWAGSGDCWGQLCGDSSSNTHCPGGYKATAHPPPDNNTAPGPGMVNWVNYNYFKPS